MNEIVENILDRLFDDARCREAGLLGLVIIIAWQVRFIITEGKVFRMSFAISFGRKKAKEIVVKLDSPPHSIATRPSELRFALEPAELPRNECGLLSHFFSGNVQGWMAGDMFTIGAGHEPSNPYITFEKFIYRKLSAPIRGTLYHNVLGIRKRNYKSILTQL
jgi:hypothetical protein